MNKIICGKATLRGNIDWGQEVHRPQKSQVLVRISFHDKSDVLFLGVTSAWLYVKNRLPLNNVIVGHNTVGRDNNSRTLAVDFVSRILC